MQDEESEAGEEEAGILLDGHHPRAVKEKEREREGGMSRLGGISGRFGYINVQFGSNGREQKYTIKVAVTKYTEPLAKRSKS